MIHVLGDVSGLTQSISLGVLTEVLKGIIEGDGDGEDDTKKKKKKNEEEEEDDDDDTNSTIVGFYSHVGGFLGGLVFYLLF